MGKTNKEQMQQRRERAIALIATRPGITPQSLATHLGLRYTGTSHSVNPVLTRLIEWLRSHPEVQVLEPDALHETIRLYPAGYELPKKQLFQPAKPDTGCKTYTVPLEELHHYTAQTSVEPVRPAIADIPTETPWKPEEPASEPISTPLQEKPVRQSASYHRAAIEEALAELVASGKPFTQGEVCTKARASVSFLHNHEDLRDKVNAAVFASKGRTPKSATPDPSVADLEKQVQELEQRNRELRQQLQEVQPPAPTQSLELKLQGEIDFWHGQIYQHRQQIQELEQAIASAQVKVEVLADLLEREHIQFVESKLGTAIAVGGVQ